MALKRANQTVVPTAMLGQSAEIPPNAGKRDERLVSEPGDGYDPRFDFSGPLCALSSLTERSRADY